MVVRMLELYSKILAWKLFKDSCFSNLPAVNLFIFRNWGCDLFWSFYTVIYLYIFCAQGFMMTMTSIEVLFTKCERGRMESLLLCDNLSVNLLVTLNLKGEIKDEILNPLPTFNLWTNVNMLIDASHRWCNFI